MVRQIRRTALVLALGTLAAPSVAAQHAHGSPETLGRVAFPTSCSAQAQPRFERAMALLHSFWWEQARDAFTEITRSDPSCAMAHFGLALTYWGNPFPGGPSGAALAAGAGAAARAVQLGAPTERERDYLAAVAALYRDHATVPNAARLRAYSDAMERLHQRHPNDPEAAIYYALSLVATAWPTDTTFERQRRANAILNPLFAERPDHPGLAHYIIHANDSPHLARYGLDAARRYAGIAPSAPHAQHMPSHIFIRLGLWEDNIASNRRSYAAGLAYAREHLGQAVTPEELHASDYLVYGYLQLGQDRAAEAAAAAALGHPSVVPAGLLVSEYARAAIPARIALERDRWSEAAALPMGPAMPPVPAAIARFARGIGAARSGDPERARAEAAELEKLEAGLTERGDRSWARVAGIKRRAVLGWAAFASGDTTRGLAEALAAADLEDVTEKSPVTPGEILPARELYADMLLAAGRFADARSAYDATLRREPNRARAVFGAAVAADRAGDRRAARTSYQAYLRLMADPDSERPGIAVARRFLGGR